MQFVLAGFLLFVAYEAFADTSYRCVRADGPIEYYTFKQGGVVTSFTEGIVPKAERRYSVIFDNPNITIFLFTAAHSPGKEPYIDKAYVGTTDKGMALAAPEQYPGNLDINEFDKTRGILFHHSLNSVDYMAHMMEAGRNVRAIGFLMSRCKQIKN